MIGRGPVTAVAVVGALVAGLAAQSAESTVGSMAWVIVSGLGLSIMLSGIPLRVLGVVLTVIGGASVARAASAHLWVAVAGFAVASVAAALMAWWGPGWVVRSRADRPRDLDPWKAMDSGIDPTAEQDVRP